MSTPKQIKEKELRLFDLRNERDRGVKIIFDGIVLEFHHLDGMYSFCTVTGGEHKGKTFHLSANAPLRKIKDGLYKVTA